jgi:hypothetical protein
MISRTRNLQDFIRISSRHARASLLGAKTKRSDPSITAQPLMWTSSRLSLLCYWDHQYSHSELVLQGSQLQAKDKCRFSLTQQRAGQLLFRYLLVQLAGHLLLVVTQLFAFVDVCQLGLQGRDFLHDPPQTSCGGFSTVP